MAGPEGLAVAGTLEPWVASIVFDGSWVQFSDDYIDIYICTHNGKIMRIICWGYIEYWQKMRRFYIIRSYY